MLSDSGPFLSAGFLRAAMPVETRAAFHSGERRIFMSTAGVSVRESPASFVGSIYRVLYEVISHRRELDRVNPFPSLSSPSRSP